jgi:hypothetical protein
VATKKLNKLIRQTESLTVDERLQLAIHLLKQARKTGSSPLPHRKWSDVRGLAASPMAGEDAQIWVSRGRQEADSHREAQWMPTE